MQTETTSRIGGIVTVASVPLVEVAGTPTLTPRLVANVAYFLLNAQTQTAQTSRALGVCAYNTRERFVRSARSLNTGLKGAGGTSGRASARYYE